MSDTVTTRQMQVLVVVPDRVDCPSDSLADILQEETHWIAGPLKALERKGLIVCTKRGGRGLPSHWRRTEAGRQAVVSIQP